MDKKTLGVVLLIAGIVLAAIFLTADITGLGEGYKFGYKQIIGTIVGAVVFVVGLVFTLKK